MTPKQKKKLARKTTTLHILDLSGIKYRTTDEIGYQIRIGDLKIDFWPTVGKWRVMPIGKTKHDPNAMIEFINKSSEKEVSSKLSLRKTSFKTSPVQKEFQSRQKKIMDHFGMNFT